MWTKAFAAVLLAAAVAVLVAGGRDTPVRRALVRDDGGRRVLDTRLAEVRLENVPLVEAVEKLRQLSGAVIAVDRPALELGGVEGVPVSVHRRNAPLGHVLESMVGQASRGSGRVAFAGDGDAVVITTAEALGRRPPVVRVYDVGDMAVVETGQPPTFGGVAGGPMNAPTTVADELESLVEETVAPDSWRNSGGSVGHVQHFAGRLVVVQTLENHRHIERLLEQLRELPPPPEPPRPGPDVLVWHEGIGEWTPVSSGPAEAALARRLPALQLDDVPLEAAIDALRKQWGVKVYVKWNEVDAQGFDRRVRVSANLRDVTLAEALDAILADHRGFGGGLRLGYAVEKGLVTIAAEAAEAPGLVTRVYDIRDWGGTATEDLIRIVTDSVAPASWREAGGELGTFREMHGILIVTQTLPNHERVRRLLNALRVASTTRPAATTLPKRSESPARRSAGDD
jgi:hypothetical protein